MSPPGWFPGWVTQSPTRSRAASEWCDSFEHVLCCGVTSQDGHRPGVGADPAGPLQCLSLACSFLECGVVLGVPEKGLGQPGRQGALRSSGRSCVPTSAEACQCFNDLLRLSSGCTHVHVSRGPGVRAQAPWLPRRDGAHASAQSSKFSELF